MRHHWFLVLPAAALLALSIWNAMRSSRLEFRLKSNGLSPDQLELALCLDDRGSSTVHCFSLAYVHQEQEGEPKSQSGEGD